MPSVRLRLPPDPIRMRGQTISELRALGGIAAPLAMTQASQLVMSLAASIVLGRISGPALAAGGLCAIFIQALTVVSQGVVAGAHPLMAAARGKAEAEGDDNGGVAYAFGGAVLAAVILAVLSVALLLHLPALLAPFGMDPVILHDVGTFIGIAAWAVPAILWVAPIRLYCSVSGKAWIVMLAVGSGAVVYMPLLSGLVLGAFGLPAYGVAGAALAYVCVWWMIAFGLTVIALARRHLPFALFAQALPTAPKAFRDVWRIGWPIALIYAAELGMTLVMTLVTSGFGAVATIANQVAYTVNSIAFNPIVAIGQAATVRVAYHMGAGRPDLARHAGNLSLLLAAGLMAAFGLVILVVSRQIGLLLLDPATPELEAIVALSQNLLFILAAFLVFDGLQSATNGALRGLKDTRQPMVIGLCGYWLVGVPIGLGLAFGFRLEAVGIWFGILAGITSVACALVMRWMCKTKAAAPPAEVTAFHVRGRRGLLRSLIRLT